ncbi:MAG TPA: hypothetical protein VFK50_11935 [Sphingomicrobium sp.]|nr:hypothetical protein [Sphingomicrobium sp.]
MRKAFGLTLASLGAILLSGAAIAASQQRNILNVPLPDGSTARVEYVGDVAPKVAVIPSPRSVTLPDIGSIHQRMSDLQRRIEAMLRNMRDLRPESFLAGPGMNVAAFGDAPVHSSSVIIVTTSNGSKTCTRKTEVTSAGPGKAPQIVTTARGDCDAAGAASNTPDNDA